mgnify:FL=1
MLSKSSGYAVRVVTFLALKRESNRNLGVKEISNKLEMPSHYIGKILQQLAKHKIITSVKGPGGGFTASENTLNSSVIDIIMAIDGSHPFKVCTLGLKDCSNTHPCPVHADISTPRDEIFFKLANKTVLDMAKSIEYEGNQKLH